MSEMSEKARAAGKEKVKRYTGENKGSVDASGWTEAPCGFMDTQKKLGNRPISKQNLACGGKAAHKHGGRKGRDMGGPASSAGANYVANVPAPPQNRFSFTGQPSPFLGAAGMAKGGKADNWIAGATKHKGALHKELGVPEGKKIPEKKLVKAEHSDNPTERKRADLAVTLKRMNKADGGQAEEIIGNRPKGGRMPRSAGGATKKGTTVNIIIAQKPEHPPMGPPGMGGGMPPKPPGPMPIPGAPPGGAPQGMPAPPPGAPPPMGSPNVPPPSMARASGGPVNFKWQPNLAPKEERTKINAVKERFAGLSQAQKDKETMGGGNLPNRASGGKVYPDMNFGAGGGKGRLEKIKKY